jgi:putative endonuclease
MDFAVYILFSLKNGSNYTGYTSHLIERIKSHNIYGKDSTAKHRPWIVVYVEFYLLKEEALKREKYFKSGRGSQLKNKIIQDFIKG